VYKVVLFVIKVRRKRPPSRVASKVALDESEFGSVVLRVGLCGAMLSGLYCCDLSCLLTCCKLEGFEFDFMPVGVVFPR